MKKKTIIILSLLAVLVAYSEETITRASVEQVAEKKRAQLSPERPDPLERPFPRHWGHPPRVQVRDHVKLPGKFGFGSSTLAKWIVQNLKKDGMVKPILEPKPKPPVKPVRHPEVLKKIEFLKEKQTEMATARKELMEDMKGKSKKTAMLLIRDFKEANKQKHLEIKEAQKAVIEDIRSRKQTGAKRD